MKIPEFCTLNCFIPLLLQFFVTLGYAANGIYRKKVRTSRAKWLEGICRNSLWFRCFCHIAWPQRVYACYMLYACPEEGCTKSYQRFSALQKHLDCGQHVRALESETMLDKAVRGYAARLEGQFASVPQFGEDTISCRCSSSTVGIADGLGSQTDPDKQSKILGQAKRVLDKQIPDRRKDRPEGESSARRKVNDDNQR